MGRNTTRRFKANSIIILILIAVFVLCNYSTVLASESEKQVVRVGFFPMRGFHEYGESGKPQGYDVDLINEMLVYNNWEVEYVRTENWEEAVEKLKNGEIDLLGSAQKVEQREKEFDFVTYPIGITYRAIVALNSSELLYHDFEEINKIKIGCVETDVRKNALTTWLQLANISPEIVYYDTFSKMEDALIAGEIGAMSCDMMEMGDNQKLVAKFAPSSFYYIVKKGNKEFLNDVNVSIARLLLNKPWLIDELMNRYYKKSYTVPLSKAELEYAKNADPIKVGVFIGRKPHSWIDEKGEIVGIIPELIKVLSKKTGFTFEIVPIVSGVSPIQALKNLEYDMVSGIVAYKKNIDDKEIKLSNPFVNSEVAFFAKVGQPFASGLQLNVATTADFEFAINYVEENYPSFNIKKYDTISDCLNAVKKNEADVVIHNTYVVEDEIRSYNYDGIEIIPTTSINELLAFAVRDDIDPLLLSTINKGIDLIDEKDKNQIIVNNTISRSKKITIIDFLMHYKKEMLMLLIITISLIVSFAYAFLLKRRNLKLVQESSHKLSNIANNVNGGVITIMPDKEFTITYANKGFLDLIGYTRDEYELIELKRGVNYVHPDDVSRLLKIAEEHSDGEQIEVELRMKNRRKGYIPTLLRGTFSSVGTSLLYCVIVDISSQKQMLEQIETEKERYRVLIETSNDIFFDVDQATQAIVCSSKYKEKFGFELSDIFNFQLPSNVLRVFPDDAAEIIRMQTDIANGKRKDTCRIRVMKKDEQYIWCEIHANVISPKDRPLRVIGKIVDVDEAVREKERLTGLTERDSLTGLYNKTAFKAGIESFLEDIHQNDIKAAILFIDMDNFKQLNDQYGHMAGDEALKEISKVLLNIFRSEDVVGRFGGDEFFVFAKGIPKSILKQKAREVCQGLQLLYGKEEKIEISASVGIFEFVGNQYTYDQILEHADEALYKAKERGKNQYIFYE